MFHIGRKRKGIYKEKKYQLDDLLNMFFNITKIEFANSEFFYNHLPYLYISRYIYLDKF